jgi:hypothetical protein
MSNKKKVFSTLATVTAGAIAGSVLALAPVAAFAGEHGEASCKGDKKHAEECKCAGEKKAECEKHHAEKSCKGEKSCSGEKH